jgi:hypothetical protein
MRIRKLVEKDSNSTRFSYQNYDSPPELMALHYQKHPGALTVTRNAQMKRRF